MSLSIQSKIGLCIAASGGYLCNQEVNQELNIKNLVDPGVTLDYTHLKQFEIPLSVGMSLLGTNNCPIIECQLLNPNGLLEAQSTQRLLNG